MAKVQALLLYMVPSGFTVGIQLLSTWSQSTMQDGKMVSPAPPFQAMHAAAAEAVPIHIAGSWQPSPCFCPHPSSFNPYPTPAPAPAPTQSSNPSDLLPPPQQVIISPCAACKILRRRCAEKCVLAPYFPPTEPLKFAVAHRIFGAGNIIKFLQEIPEHQRADAASSLVYEANARVRDPVYGCAGAVFQLQRQVSELHAQLAMAKVELHKMQLQQSNLVALICMETNQFQDQEGLISQQQQNYPFIDDFSIL